MALPGSQACADCPENCYQELLARLETANSWLQAWNKKLELTANYQRSSQQPDRQLSRRELFTGLGWNVKREVKEMVAEELENRLTRVLPRTEQGYMRRREASINDVPIEESERRIHGPRPQAERGGPAQPLR